MIVEYWTDLLDPEVAILVQIDGTQGKTYHCEDLRYYTGSGSYTESSEVHEILLSFDEGNTWRESTIAEGLLLQIEAINELHCAEVEEPEYEMEY